MKHKIQRVTLSIGIILLFSWQVITAKIDGVPSSYAHQDTVHGLFFDLENLNFFSNNEYNSNVLHGYTTLGTWINGSVKFRRNDKISLEAGVQFNRLFGADSMSSRSPFFLRVKFTPLPKLAIILGELDHQHYWTMPRQILDLDNLFTNSREEGLQVKYAGDRFFNGEIWVNWERMIYRGSTFREQLTAGITGEVILVNKNKLHITLPVNYLAKHWGGEIDLAPKLAETLANTSFGVNIQKATSHSHFQAYGLKFSTMTFSRSKHSNFVPFSSGSAFYPQAFLKIKQSNLSIGYWHSKNFAAYWGDPYYSNQLMDKTISPRSLIDFNYSWNYHYSKNLLFSFRTQLYYDPKGDNLDLRAGVILHIKESFKLREYK